MNRVCLVCNVCDVGAAMDELNRYIGEIDVRKLDSLLKMAIHISTAQVGYRDGVVMSIHLRMRLMNRPIARLQADPHKDNLYCVMESYNLSQHLEAIHSTSQGMDGPIGLAAGLWFLAFTSRVDTLILKGSTLCWCRL